MLLQPITVPFSKSTLKPSVYTLKAKPSLLYSSLKLTDPLFFELLSVFTLPTHHFANGYHLAN